MICCFLSCTCPLEEKSTRKFWFYARLAELSLIFLLSHSRSRAHEGESGKTEAPAKLSAPRSLHFFSINFAWLWWRKDDRSWSNLIAAVVQKYILRCLKLHASKDYLNQSVHSHEYCWVIKEIDRYDWYRQIGNMHSLQNEREFQILRRTWARTYSLVWRAIPRIRLFCLCIRELFSKPLTYNWFQVLRFANATILIQNKHQ